MGRSEPNMAGCAEDFETSQRETISLAKVIRPASNARCEFVRLYLDRLILEIEVRHLGFKFLTNRIAKLSAERKSEISGMK